MSKTKQEYKDKKRTKLRNPEIPLRVGADRRKLKDKKIRVLTRNAK